MTSKKKAAALRLVLPGAPANWHTVDGLPGHYHPDKATPLDGPWAPSTEQAQDFIAAHASAVDEAAAAWETFREQQIAKDAGDIGEFVRPDCPVELVEVSEAEAERLREELVGQHGEALRAAYIAARSGEGALPQVENELAAVAAGDTSDNQGD